MLLVGLGLLAAALLLVIAEVFLPSAGLLSIGAGAEARPGIMVRCERLVGQAWGYIGGGLGLGGEPGAISMALKEWLCTRTGKKRLQGEVTEEQLEAQRRVEVEARERRRALVGAEGEVITPLRPVGVVRIADQRYDALAETGIIETGQRVRVTAVQDHQIKVRAV